MNVDRLRRTLLKHYYYIKLVTALVPKGTGAGAQYLDAFLLDLNDFLKEASNRQVKTKGLELESAMAHAIEICQQRLPAKKPIHGIAEEFQSIINEGEDVWRYGLEFGWLASRFDISYLSFPQDLPFHARIGIGAHAGFSGIEEVILVEDAFFMLASARNANKIMWDASKEKTVLGPKSADEWRSAHQLLTRLNSNVCAFSRLGVVSSAAFVESFVNSVGHHYAKLNKTLEVEVREQLEGTKKGRYLSLETKLEKFPALIRKDGKSPINVSDEKQLKEPFRSFLKETKEVRDSSVHYSPSKAAIWRPPQDWLLLVEAAVSHSVEVAKEFWLACYPGGDGPDYLYKLDYNYFLTRANGRLDQKAAENAGSI